MCSLFSYVCQFCREMVLFVSLLIISSLHLSGAMESRIIGGNEAKPHSRPYMVSFQMDNEHKCGGMLITENYVLTSAHCLNGYEPSGGKKLEVLLGAHNISRKEPSQQRIRVEKYIMHPSYKEGQKDRSYDVMLLKLETKAKVNKYVNFHALPKKNKTIPAHQKCSIAGWGIKGSGEHQASDVLLEVTLKVQFNFECKNSWRDYFDSMCMICTASNGIRAFCQVLNSVTAHSLKAVLYCTLHVMVFLKIVATVDQMLRNTC
uniref:trypsin n=1 Tax=Pygocentrus nattereri TaxID=42514 RepID=A0AAR2KPH5_PYGNA